MASIASDFSTLLYIKQGEKEDDAIWNRISDINKRRISQTKNSINKLAMNNRRLMIAAEFHFVRPVEKDS